MLALLFWVLDGGDVGVEEGYIGDFITFEGSNLVTSKYFPAN